MDNKQAIKNIKDLKKWKYLGDRKYMLALDKAIASLEAWDKVIKESEQEMNEYENVLSDLSYSDGVGYALAVIEEHLKEIEE